MNLRSGKEFGEEGNDFSCGCIEFEVSVRHSSGDNFKASF